MKRRFNPPALPLCFGLLGIFMLLGHLPAFAQCKGDFHHKAVYNPQASAGAIEITVKDPEPGPYTFKIYSISGKITLAESRQKNSSEKIVLDNLRPDTYLVRIEWGDSCYTVVGGLEGILITDKSPAR